MLLLIIIIHKPLTLILIRYIHLCINTMQHLILLLLGSLPHLNIISNNNNLLLICHPIILHIHIKQLQGMPIKQGQEDQGQGQQV